MKCVVEALTVSRSRLAERVKEPAQERPPRYLKDEALLPLIYGVINHRLPYGYCWVCAVLNRRLKQEGHASANHSAYIRLCIFMACVGPDHGLPARPQQRRQGHHPQNQSSLVLRWV